MWNFLLDASKSDFKERKNCITKVFITEKNLFFDSTTSLEKFKMKIKFVYFTHLTSL